MDENLIFLAETTAMQFAWAYERCMDPMSERGSASETLPIPTPAIICAAFGAELGFKSILQRHGVAAKGHDLKVLFDHLPDDVQVFLRARIEPHFPDFDDQLDFCKNAFVEWRYIFEQKTPKQLNSNFLHLLACHAVEYVSSKHWGR